MENRRNSYFAILFCLLLVIGVLFLFLGWGSKKQNFVLNSIREFTESAESTINEVLDRNHTFIEIYGGYQELMGRRVVEDTEPKYTVVKLTDEILTFANLGAVQQDMTERAEKMVQFSQRVRERFQIPTLYIQAPSKLDMAELPDGISDYSGAEADQFLALVEQGGMDTLDLRPAFRKAFEADSNALGELFFHTDHHWTPEGAFLGFEAICRKLESQYHFQIDTAITNPDSYTKERFENIFLGSQGRRVGTFYAGTDGINLWTPNFETHFQYSVPLSGIEREGPFSESLLFREQLNTGGSYYETNPYVVYSGGDFLLARAVNEDNPDAPRVLIFRDSFGCALTPFLSLVCGEMMAVDPRYFNGGQEEMFEYIEWLNPDILLILNTTGSLRVEEMYPYL